MKKSIAIILTILSGILILDSFQAAQAVMMLVLAGEVPGTSIILSATTMLETCLLITGFVCARLMVALFNSLRNPAPKRSVA
jgi:hypothetical protein